jgi:hypothetical protein
LGALRLFPEGKKENKIEEGKIKESIEVMAMKLGKVNWRIV